MLINFHLEAYDSGEGKIAQSKMLADILEAEYEKGNYVIAGGDFNQTFEGVDKYPVTNKEDWAPGVIGTDDLPDHFSFAIDDTYPTCRPSERPRTPVPMTPHRSMSSTIYRVRQSGRQKCERH